MLYLLDLAQSRDIDLQLTDVQNLIHLLLPELICQEVIQILLIHQL